jgi:hypothetical protein
MGWKFKLQEQKPESESPSEKRRTARVPLKTPAEVRIVAPGVNAVGYLVDMSEDGVGVATVGALLAVGEEVSIEMLPSQAGEGPTTLRAIVQYSRGVRYGFKFLKDAGV